MYIEMINNLTQTINYSNSTKKNGFKNIQIQTKKRRELNLLIHTKTDLSIVHG